VEIENVCAFDFLARCPFRFTSSSTMLGALKTVEKTETIIHSPYVFSIPPRYLQAFNRRYGTIPYLQCSHFLWRKREKIAYAAEQFH
jgi:hypothetical protein